MDATVEIQTNCSLAAVRKIANVFEETLRHLVPPEYIASVQLAVTEACTNLVLHGAEGRESSPLSARLELVERTVRVTLIDEGKSFDLRRSDRPPLMHDDPNDVPTCGRGVLLINDLMDQVEYEVRDGQNVMTLTKTVTRLPLEEAWDEGRKTEQAT
jgi:serine/threonine-protein kinase RsbW